MEQLTTTTMTTRMWRNYACGWLAYMLLLVIMLRLANTNGPHGFDWHVVTAGAKGCVTFRRDPVREFRDFLQIDARLGHLHWLMQHNGGVFLPPWGKVEQWLLSVQHDRDDVDRFAANFARFAEAIA